MQKGARKIKETIVTINVNSELTQLAKAFQEVETKGHIQAICVIVSGNDNADEQAYWSAVRMGAQECDFWILGESPKIRAIDKEWGKVTSWFETGAKLPEGHVITIDAN